MATSCARKQGVRVLAWVAGTAFLLATHYCICEAFSSSRGHVDSSHQHAPASHHDESPSNHEDDPCCATLQAVVTPHSALLVAGPQLLFQEVPLQAANIVRLADLSFAPTGLSPPAREPTSARPFYRTTFASHAPPIHLA